MKILWLFFFLTVNVLAEVPLPRGGTGLELGVARMSDGKKSEIGTSWVYVFEFQPDQYLSFFGQAGINKSEEKSFEQTSFNGGVQLFLLPELGFQLGLSTVVNKVEEKRETELGPLVAVNFYVPLGVFKLGTSATLIKTQALQTIALRAGLLLEL